MPYSCQVESFVHIKRFLGVTWASPDVRCNGLLLCKSMELAFYKLKLGFVYDPGRNSWLVHVFDDNLTGDLTFVDRDQTPTDVQPPDLTRDCIRGGSC